MNTTMKRFGLDFGTTNTVLAGLDSHSGSGGATVVRFAGVDPGETTDTFRSVLYAEEDENSRQQRVRFWAGADALREYLRMGQYGRLLQSLKSYLASPHFTHSNVCGRTMTLEDLISTFLNLMLDDSGMADAVRAGTVVVGRPVRFVAQNADATLALARLTKACAGAGLNDIRFVEEPVAAAYAYATQVDSQRTVLICDLGGGTTDYSLLRVVKPGANPQVDVIATDGVALAGDDCDAAIIQHAVAPHFGLNHTLSNGQEPPRWLFDNLARWHHLSFLRTPQNVRLLEQLGLSAFHTLVTHNGGMALARAVQAAKAALSNADETVLRFQFEDIDITAPLARADFEQWITPVTAAMGNTLDDMLQRAGVAPHAIDDVFLTGGTSFIPAVRALYASRFGEHKIHAGGEFTSVAAGLALAG
jgi:hypothetical chaperone protein